MCNIMYDLVVVSLWFLCFFFKQKTAYELRISDWSSDVCSSDLAVHGARQSRPGCCLSIAFVSVPLNVVFPCVISMLSWAKSIISLGLVILTGGRCSGR